MPQRCTVCDHPDRRIIDRLLVRQQRSNRRVASQFRLVETSLRRHAEKHLPKALAKAADAVAATHADELLAELDELRGRTEAILLSAEGSGDHKIALGAIRESRGNLELLARLLGELRDQTTINVLLTPEWRQIQTALADALDAFPEARLKVADVLARIAEASGARE